jgi:hypothetical protein
MSSRALTGRPIAGAVPKRAKRLSLIEADGTLHVVHAGDADPRVVHRSHIVEEIRPLAQHGVLFRRERRRATDGPRAVRKVTRRSASRWGSGWRRTVRTRVKTAVVALIPRATTARAAAAWEGSGPACERRSGRRGKPEFSRCRWSCVLRRVSRGVSPSRARRSSDARAPRDRSSGSRAHGRGSRSRG